MKIKTIVHEDPGAFDEHVNLMLGQGYRLQQRGLMQLSSVVKHYAQLVQPDPAPVEVDLLQCLRHVKEFCAGVPKEDCQEGRCPLRAWCDESTGGLDPADWELPEVET